MGSLPPLETCGGAQQVLARPGPKLITSHAVSFVHTVNETRLPRMTGRNLFTA